MPTVLVVDDDTDVRKVLRRALGNAGFNVLEADSAAAARHIARSASAVFDAVVLDYGLPDGRGGDVLVEIRRFRPDVPVVMFSGQLTDGPLAERLLAFGGVRICHKPDVLGVVAALVELCTPARVAAVAGK